MRKFFIVVWCLLFTGMASSAAQNTADVRGEIKEKASGEPAGFSTVAIVRNDSIVVSGSMAAEDGTFCLSAAPGEYTLVISLMGFKDFRASFELTEGGKNFGLIELEDDALSIEEAVVKASLPRTELKGDAIVTNITGSVMEHMGNAQDLLAKIPGMISKNGKIEVLGRGEPQYYINGRKVVNTDELRSLMSEDIRSIEVVSTPGAMYSADVKAVVRIKTIKRQGDGFSFALTSQGQKYLQTKDFDPSWTVLDLNYRKGGLDLIGKVTYFNNRNYQIADAIGESYLPGRAFKQLIDMSYETHASGLNGRFGLNWQICPDHSVGFQVEKHSVLKGYQDGLVDELVFENDSQVDHLVSRNEYLVDNSGQWEGNIYYNGKVNGLEIDFNTDFSVSSEIDLNRVEEKSEIEPRDFRTTLDKGSGLIASKLVLSHPIGKGKISGGAEEIYTSLRQAQLVSTDILPSSSSSQRENTIAGFAEYSIAWKSSQLVAGLRFEHVDFAYDDLMGSDDLQRHENYLFPSLSFSTKAGPVDLSVNFSGKTKRPNYWRLSNELTYVSRFAYQTGNPKLKSEKFLDLTLNARWKWLSFSAIYEKVTDGIETWASPYDDKGVVLLKYENIDKPIRVFNAFLSAVPSVGCWSPQYMVGFRRQFLKLELMDPREVSGFRQVAFEMPEFYLQLNNSFRFGKGWQLSLDYQYRSPMFDGTAQIIEGMNLLEAAVQKSFLKDDALTFRLSVKDILNDSNEYIYVDRGSVIDTQNNYYKTQAVVLRVSYRFNSAASKYKGMGAGQSAKERL